MTAPELAGIAGITGEPGALAQPDAGADAFISELARAGHFPESIRALAYALPGAAAVGWAAGCIGKFAAPDNDAEKSAHEAVDRWLADSTDENRRAAMEAAERAGIGTPAGCLGFAVFLSGGSVAPIQAPEVLPVPGTSTKAVAGAVVLAIVSRQPDKAPNRYRAAIDDGMHRAAELKLWEK
jgi:Family of unknown function (DUF6931)